MKKKSAILSAVLAARVFTPGVFVLLAAVWFILPATCCLAFEESFEAVAGMSGTPGRIDGQNGWEAVGLSANVQSNLAESGFQSLEIRQAAVQRGLSGEVALLWIAFRANIADAPVSVPAIDENQTSLAFYLNTNMNVVVFSNTVPVELSVAVSSNVWTRFDVFADFTAMTWTLAVNGTNAAEKLAMHADSGSLSGLLIANDNPSAVFVDNITATATEPAGRLPDSDGDGIPDWWEQTYFGGATNAAAAGDTDQDGRTEIQEYLAGLDPAIPDGFLVGSSFSGNLALSWPTRPERLYSVYWAPDLKTGFSLLQADLPWTQPSLITPLPTNHPAAFYRIQIRPGW